MEINGNKSVITNVNKEKDIGIIFDEGLHFYDYITEKINKANKLYGLLRRSFKYLTPEMFQPLYKALVRSHFDYATPI